MTATLYRLFVAVELPPAMRAALAGLRCPLPGAAWVRTEALHLTLRFLGDGISDGQRDLVLQALAAVDAPAFCFEVGGVGQFPPHGPARVLWAGVQAPPALFTLVQAVSAAVEAAGFAPEPRPFSPHITLARLKGRPAPEPIAAFIAAQRGFQAGSAQASAFALMASAPGPQGSVYAVVSAWPLRAVSDEGLQCD